MRVFLIHGMGRSRASMARLSRHLQRRGHSTSIFGYMVTREPLPAIAEGFRRHIEKRRDDEEDYAIVGHSLGNIITRLASPELPAGLSRFAMLAPPNQSPALARLGGRYTAFRVLTGDAGRRLGDRAFYDSLPVPQVPCLIIAGEAQGRAPWLPHRGPASDGIVSVDETRLAGIDHRVVPCAHTFIMDHPEARSLVRSFLDDGSDASDGG